MTSPLRVLIIEDSQDDAQLILRELRRGGYDPIFERVETDDQMQAAFKKQDWELILCDYVLPGFSAPKALGLLAETALDIPFIVVSGKIGEDTAVEMMRAGAHDYMMKDNLARLTPAVTRELAEADIRRHRKRAEEALQKERDFAEALIRTAQTIVLVLDTEGQIVRFNPYMEKISGYCLEEVRGKDWFSTFLPQRDWKHIRELFLKAIGDIQTRGNVNPIVTRDGRERQIEWFDKALKDNNGNIVGLLATGQDITERKRAEEDIADLAKFPAENPDPVLRVANDGAIIFANKAARPLLDAWSCQVDQALPKRWAELVASVLVSGAREDVEMDCDGRVFLVTFAPVVEAGYVNLYGHDITDRKLAEETLRESEDRYRTLVQNQGEGIGFVDTEENFTFANPAGHKIFGVPPGGLIGRNLREFVDEETFALIQAQTKVHLAGKKSIYEIDFDRPDGQKCNLLVTATPRFDSEGQFIGTFGIFRDITDRKLAEEDVKRSHEELRALATQLQAAGEEERTRLARKFHDDVGNSLVAIKMDLAWLNRRLPEVADGPSRPKLRERLESMSKMLAETIQTARETASELRPGVLDDVGLAAAVAWEARQFEERSGVKCTFTSPGEEMELDHEQSTALFRICQELLTNIARHAGATSVRIALKRRADELILEVSDNGRGIREEQISSSMSLGILGMRERALALGGQFSISGTPGKGTTATVKIPLTAPVPAPAKGTQHG